MKNVKEILNGLVEKELTEKRGAGSKIQKNLDDLTKIIRKLYIIKPEIKATDNKAFNELSSVLKNLEKAEIHMMKIIGIL